MGDELFPRGPSFDVLANTGGLGLAELKHNGKQGAPAWGWKCVDRIMESAEMEWRYMNESPLNTEDECGEDHKETKWLLQ